MKNNLIQKIIEIDASPDKVWRVFTDPVVTRQMGGEYVSDWKSGSSFGWKGANGNMYTHGTILQIETERLLQHQLFENDERKKILSVITYTFSDDHGRTILGAREVLHNEMTDEQYQDTSDGWDIALAAIKKAAEDL